MTLSQLQKLLNRDNQWLPIRPPFFDADSTTGALLAMGTSGPERMLYGAPRDVVLGLQYIDPKGRMISTGGKVVKNVAGYDMTRLLIGSNGSLGMITEGTWRISTRPERCMSALGTGDLNTCFTAAVKLMNSNLMPSFVTAVPDSSAPGKLPGQWKLSAGFEGFSKVVEHQTERCTLMLGESGLKTGAAENYDLIDGCHKEDFNKIALASFVLKAGTSTGKMPAVIDEIEKHAHVTDWLLDFGCGRIFCGLGSLEGDKWNSLSQETQSMESFVMLEKSTESFCREQDIFCGFPRDEWSPMHKIKKALDPQSIFAPGRMPGKK